MTPLSGGRLAWHVGSPGFHLKHCKFKKKKIYTTIRLSKCQSRENYQKWVLSIVYPFHNMAVSKCLPQVKGTRIHLAQKFPSIPAGNLFTSRWKERGQGLEWVKAEREGGFLLLPTYSIIRTLSCGMGYPHSMWLFLLYLILSESNPTLPMFHSNLTVTGCRDVSVFKNMYCSSRGSELSSRSS